MTTAATETTHDTPMSSPSPKAATDMRLVDDSTLEGLLELQTLVGLKRPHEDIHAVFCAAWEPLVTFETENESNYYGVKHLDLGGCRFRRPGRLPIDAIDVLVNHFHDIESLNLGGTDLSATETVYLLKKMKCELQSLHVAGNGWGDAGMTHFANEWLTDTENSEGYALETLDVRYNGIGAEGARALSRALKILEPYYGDYAGITKIYLEGNRLHDEGVIALSEVLGNPNRNKDVCQVQELFLGANGIGVAGATALANALDTNRHLVKLHIEGNAIQAQGALAFCRVLEEHNEATHGPMGLKHVYCDNNDIGKEVSQRLAKALNNDTSILGESL